MPAGTKSLESRKAPQTPELGTLESLVLYFCFKANPRSQTKLMKLVYLAEAYHFETYGKRMTRAKFRHWHYGPYSDEVANTFEQLYAQGVLRERRVQTSTGARAEVATPTVKRTWVTLTEEQKRTADLVLQQWGTAPTNKVVRYAKETLPFLGTPFGSLIDFTRTDPVEAYARLKGVDRKAAAAAFVEQSPKLKQALEQGIQDLRSGRLVSHAEVFGKSR